MKASLNEIKGDDEETTVKPERLPAHIKAIPTLVRLIEEEPDLINNISALSRKSNITRDTVRKAVAEIKKSESGYRLYKV